MADNDRCPKCGSADRVPDVHVHGDFHKRPLKAQIVENPEAWIDKGIHESDLTATICGRCGFAELYAKNSEELLRACRQKQPPG
jgi:predicted nucleic-acid-binding Zn-ribbon protein